MIRTSDIRVTLALLTCGLAGGCLFIFVKLLMGDITPLQLAAARTALAAPILMSIVLLRQSMPSLGRTLVVGAIILALVDTATPFLLIAWASQHIPSSTAALLVSTMPLFTTLIASLKLPDERLSAYVFVGLACSALGIVVLTGPAALDIGSSSSLAALAVLLSAVCYAIGIVYSRFLLRLSDPVSLTALKLSFAALVLVPIALAVDGMTGFASLGAMGWVGLVEVCIISTGFGRSLVQWVVSTAGSVRASLVTYIIPVVTLILSWTVVGDPVKANTAAGAVLVMSGVALVMYGPDMMLRGLAALRPSKTSLPKARTDLEYSPRPPVTR